METDLYYFASYMLVLVLIYVILSNCLRGSLLKLRCNIKLQQLLSHMTVCVYEQAAGPCLIYFIRN